MSNHDPCQFEDPCQTAANAIGNVFIQALTEFSTDVIGLEAGEILIARPVSHFVLSHLYLNHPQVAQIGLLAPRIPTIYVPKTLR